MKNRPEYIVIHHSGGRPGRTAADITRVHRRRGFRTIGYHFVVLTSGLCEVGRPWDQAGAHAKGLNTRSIGVCVVGTFDSAPPPTAQMYSLTIVVKALQQLHHIDADHVIGHREINTILPERYHTPKHCPGRAFNMDAFRAGLHQTVESEQEPIA